MRRFFTILVICLFIGQFAYAIPPSKDFYSDDTIQTGETWMNVGIYDTPPNHTTVDMTGGYIYEWIHAYNASTLNISGGNIAGSLNANESSTVNISGGSVYGLDVYNNATANISQNASIYSAWAYSGIINMNGGTIYSIAAYDSAVFNLKGGTISIISGGSPATINVFGYDLAKTSVGGNWGYGQVSGFWQSGSPFTIDFYSLAAYSTINLIPEPATFLLLGAGAFLLKKSNRRMKNRSI